MKITTSVLLLLAASTDAKRANRGVDSLAMKRQENMEEHPTVGGFKLSLPKTRRQKKAEEEAAAKKAKEEEEERERKEAEEEAEAAAEKKKRNEERAAKKAAEEAAKKAAEEEAARKAEEEAEHEAANEERQKKLEELKRQEEELKKQAEEEQNASSDDESPIEEEVSTVESEPSEEESVESPIEEEPSEEEESETPQPTAEELAAQMLAEAKAIVETIQQKLAKKHYTTEEKLAKFFMDYDYDFDDKLNLENFTAAMDHLGFEEADAQKAFGYLDKNLSGNIAYDEFMLMAKGPMDEDRQEYVDYLFQQLDKDADGEIDLEDLEAFHAAERPDAPLTAVQIQQFGDYISMMLSALGEDGHVIGKTQWNAYYDLVSASIDDDVSFSAMMDQTWLNQM